MKKLLLLILIVLVMMPLTVMAQDEEEEELQIALYYVNDDGTLEFAEGEEDDGHYLLWDTVTLLLPADYIVSYVFEFAVFESEDTFAYVSETQEDVWQFAMNVEASPETILTIVHEFGHIVALNNEQYETYPTTIADSLGEIESDEAYNDGLAADMEACSTIAFDDGCPLEGSYILDFTETFWADDAALAMSGEVDPVEEFYDANPDGYVNDYAATDPTEDFAETFAYFVALDDESITEAETLADEKILWFYDNPDMMALRDEIRANAEDNNLELVLPED